MMLYSLVDLQRMSLAQIHMVSSLTEAAMQPLAAQDIPAARLASAWCELTGRMTIRAG